MNNKASAEVKPWFYHFLTPKDAKKVELTMKLFRTDESLDSSKISIVGRAQSLECIVEEPNKVVTIARVPSKIIKGMPEDVPDISFAYEVLGRRLNISYNANPQDGAYFKVELLPYCKK